MGSDDEQVAKVWIHVEADGQSLSLLSRKRAKGKRKHGRLELLGGHLEPGETPLEALTRELAEEERTGRLAEAARAAAPEGEPFRAGGALHHLFQLTLSGTEAAQLEADPEESLGYELVRTASLLGGAEEGRLTWRTGKILDTVRRRWRDLEGPGGG